MKEKGFLGKFYNILKWTENIAAGTCLGVIVILIALQIFFRYVLNNPLSWSDTLARFLFVWMVFIGAAIGLREKGHIGIEGLASRFPVKMQNIFQLIIQIGIIIMSIFLIVYGMKFANQASYSALPALKISLKYIMLPIPVSATLMLLHSLIMLVDYLRK